MGASMQPLDSANSKGFLQHHLQGTHSRKPSIRHPSTVGGGRGLRQWRHQAQVSRGDLQRAPSLCPSRLALALQWPRSLETQGLSPCIRTDSVGRDTTVQLNHASPMLLACQERLLPGLSPGLCRGRQDGQGWRTECPTLIKGRVLMHP